MNDRDGLLGEYAKSLSRLSTLWRTPGSEAASTLRRGSSQPAAPAPPRPLGSEVNGRYRIEAVLGAGGMGRVYRVRDSLYPDRPTALKTLLTAVSLETEALFRIEFQAMASLGHPGIARVYDFERIVGGDGFFFTMELLAGRDLASVTDRSDWRRTAARLSQVAQALDYIHRHGIIHLDVKPRNVIVSTDADGGERLKVLDFGLAGMNQYQGLFGTYMYIAPEVTDGLVPDRRADIYALGVMAFELLCGRSPYDPGLAPPDLFDQKRNHPIVFPEDLEAGPAWLRETVERMCAIDRDARFQNAGEVARRLDQGVDGSGQPVLAAIATSRFVGRALELDRVVDHVRTRLRPDAPPGKWLFVRGASGVGKSRLIREARHLLQVADVVFLGGDCFADDLAEHTAITAVMLGAAGLAIANDALDLIQEHGPEIVKLAPGFGAANGVVASPALENARAERRRILRASADFLLGLSARVGFVVSFNDLQWAPRGSIDVLLTLLERSQAFPEARLPLLGTYRAEGVAGTPLEALLRACEAGAGCEYISLVPLEAGEAAAIVESMLGPGVPAGLLHDLHAATGGEPFLLEQAVRNLVAAGGFAPRDGAAARPAGSEHGPSAPIAADAAVLQGVARLDALDRRLVELLAACGRPVPASVLAAAAAIPLAAAQSRLRSLEERQLVVLLAGKDSKHGLAHDRIREAVYAASEAAARRSLHKRLGESYAAALPAEDAGEYLLATAAQLMAAGTPDDQAQALAWAEIAIRAARSAHNATAFPQALLYLDAAAGWLPDPRFERCREVALQLEEQRAYTCIAAERLDAAEESGLLLERYATDALQGARGRRAWMACQLRKGNLRAVIESGIELVRRLGEPLPRRPNRLHVLLAIARVRRRLTPSLLRRLETLPRMTDPRAVEIDKCLEALFLGAYLSEPALTPVIEDVALRLMTTYGLSSSSSVTLLTAGLLMAVWGDLPRAHAVSDVAMRLLPHTHRSSLGLARFSYNGGIRHCRDAFQAISDDLLATRDECLEVGDNIFAGMASISRIAIDVASGAPLGPIQAFMEDATTHHILASSALTRRMEGVVRQAVRQLRDGVDARLPEARGPTAPDADDQQARNEHAYYLLLVAASYRLAPPPDVLGLRVPLTIERIWAGTPFVPETYFSWALCLLNAARAGARAWLPGTLAYKVGLMRRRLEGWVSRYPRNHRHRATLLAAEWLRRRRRLSDALPLFARAAAEADAAGDARLAGLAHELGADAHLELGDRDRARAWLAAARASYLRWNAPGKVEDLERRYRDALS